MTTKNKQTKAVAVTEKDITAEVLTKIEGFKASQELRIPKDYSPENALKSAYLVLSEMKNAAGKNPMQVCTKASIANALLKMVVWGLSPMKQQMSFIMYGDQLQAQPEYSGNIALAKRWGGMKDIKASAVFKGDDFEWEVDPHTGRKRIIKHKQSLAALEKQEVIGAYAVVTMEDGSTFTEIMAMGQIRKAWQQGAAKGNSPAHRNFPDQMAIKTVANRACKLLIRGSDDSILYSPEDDVKTDSTEADVEHEIKTEANAEVIDFEEVTEEEDLTDEEYEETLQEKRPAEPAPEKTSAADVAKEDIEEEDYTDPGF